MKRDLLHRVRFLRGPMAGTLLAMAMAFAAAASAYAELPWWRDARGPAYQVLVYSFADSDGDGWGDLRGLTDKLDYLAGELGVSALWLSPINTASSYHGYDVVDYRAVDPRLGSMADFERLTAAASERGVKIILDLVFNHTSREHPWFIDALKSASSPYASWYRRREPGVSYGSGGLGRFYRATRPDGSSFEYFSAFWEGMPDLNLDNTDVVNELKSIMAFWLEKGADGFRFDAAKHAFDPNEMPSGTGTLALNRAFWNDLRRAARRVKPDVFFIGEVLSESVLELVAYAPVFDSLFDFPSARQILDLLGRGTPGNFLSAYASAYGQYVRAPGFTPAPLLTNHDQDRAMSFILSRLGLDAAAGAGFEPADVAAVRGSKELAWARAKMGASLYQTLPGLPFVYYGEELGMTGRRYANDDLARRDAFPWKAGPGLPNVAWPRSSAKVEPGQNRLTPVLADQLADAASLLNHYRSLAALRAASPALRRGGYAPVPWAELQGGYLLAWLRPDESETALVMHNLDSIPWAGRAPAGVRLKALWSSAGDLAVGAAPLAPGASLSLGPGESAVFIVLP